MGESGRTPTGADALRTADDRRLRPEIIPAVEIVQAVEDRVWSGTERPHRFGPHPLESEQSSGPPLRQVTTAPMDELARRQMPAVAAMAVRDPDTADDGESIGASHGPPERGERRMEAESPTEIDRPVPLPRRSDGEPRSAVDVGAVGMGHEHAQTVEPSDEGDDHEGPLGRSDAATLLQECRFHQRDFDPRTRHL